jgi:O-antigen/teichoic acid export membrane protein
MGGDLLGRCVGLGRMVVSSWRPLWQHVGRPVAANVAVAFRKYRQFPMYSLPSTIIDTLVINLPLLLVGYFYGPGAAGQFTLVQRLLTIPIAPISGSVADAFHGRAATYLRDDPAALKGFFLRTSKFLLLSGIVPTLAIMILAPLTFGWIFGATWATAGVLTAIMAPPMFGHLVISPSTRLFVLVEGGPKTKLIADAVGISAVVGTLFSGHALGWDLRRTLTLFSAVYCCALAFYFFILYRLVLQAERKR